jgi:Ca-activated chloride channel family protein
MHRSLLLLALIPAACGPSFTPSANAASFPDGAVRYDASCFGQAEREAPQAAGAWGGGPGSGSTVSQKAGRASAKPAPPPSAAPSSPGPMAGGYLDDAMAEESVAAPSPMPPYLGEEKAKKEADSDEGRQVAQRSFDWGGTTWLSNDDSMSLASAQRLLWAVANGRAFTPAQIRPHELLNYFSFDTETPEAGEAFEVTASAERVGDGLSVAFAVQGASPERQPLDLTLVVDRSCSMEAEGRMEYTKRGLTRMTEQLDHGDRVDVVMFDDAVCTPLENFVVGRDDPALLEKVIRQMRPEGGTDVDLGLREAYAVASRKADTHQRNRRVMAITDAMMNTGDINPDTVSEIGRKVEEDGIRLTGVGVGWEFNDEVLNKLTEKGKGAYVFLGSEAVVDRVFGAGFDGLVQTIAHDVRFQMDLPVGSGNSDRSHSGNSVRFAPERARP